MTDDEGRQARPQGPNAERLIRHATLRQLQLLEAIVRLGSFTRAAEELYLTQPTVSMQIKKLADTVGMPLFSHVGRNVEPTEAGREVHAACRAILRTLSDLEVRLSDLAGLRRGHLRLGVITTAKYFAPEILGAFCEQYPGIEVSLKVTNRNRILERMAAAEDDVYIFGNPEEAGMEVASVYLAPNPLVMVARQGHPLVGQRGIGLERIAGERFLMREGGSGIRESVLRRFAERGLSPHVHMELGSNEAIKYAVYAGLGIAVLSLHSLALDHGVGRIAMLDVEGFPFERSWYLIYPKGRELSLVARTFVEFAVTRQPEIRALLDTTLSDLKRTSGLLPDAPPPERSDA